MSTEKDLLHDPKITGAVEQIRTLIQEHYPTVRFTIFRGEDPDGIYLRAAVDVDDPDEVMDLAIDRLMEYQLGQGLPVYLLPVRTDERIATEVAARKTRRSHAVPLSHFPSRGCAR